MGNQIAAFFDTQKGDGAEAVAAHIKKFWTRSMCDTLVAHIEAGGEAAPLVKQAVARLSS
jgi:formate dehydrogenase subunit delta